MVAEPFDAYDSARTVVLGASGFIGRWVARHLTRQGADVRAFVRDATRAETILGEYGVEAEVTDVDLDDLTRLRALLRSTRPHVVFNLVGYGVDRSERDERQAFRINARLLPALVRALPAALDSAWPGQQLVHVGSAFEYGQIGGDLAESSVARPKTLYGRSKLAGTLLLARESRRAGVRAFTARPFTVYGPGEHPGRLLPALFEAAESGRPMQLTSGDQRRDFTYVEDVVDGLLRLALAPVEPGSVVNLATGRLTSVREFVQTAAGVLGIRSDALQFGALPTRSDETAHDPVKLTRLRQLTGWLPATTIAQGVTRTLEHRRAGLS